MKTCWAMVLWGAMMMATAADYRDIETRVMPVPQKIEVLSDETTPLKAGTIFKVVSPLKADEVTALVTEAVNRYWHFTP